MNGYQYLVARNRLMQQLETSCAACRQLPPAEREAKRDVMRAEFDVRWPRCTRQVADEFPGERKKKARPLPILGKPLRAQIGSLNQHPGRAHSQPGEYLARNSARQADRGDRGLGFGQIEPGLRHALRRGTAALRAEPVDLRAAVPGADGAAGRRFDFRYSAGARAAAEKHNQECALDGRHRHRDQRLPAPAVCDGRAHDMPAMRQSR